jgi:hypothetical protein
VRIDVEVLKREGGPGVLPRALRGQERRGGRAATSSSWTPSGTPQRVVRLEHELTTRERAVTGEVGRCTDVPIPTPLPSP